MSFLVEYEGWCSLTEIAKATQLSEDKVKEIAQSFGQAKFAEFDEQLGRIKLGFLLRTLYIDLKGNVK